MHQQQTSMRAAPGLGKESSQNYCGCTDAAMSSTIHKHLRVMDVRASQWLRNTSITEAMKKIEECIGFQDQPIKGALCCRNLRKWRLDPRLETIYLQDNDGLEHHVDCQGVRSEHMASTPLEAQMNHMMGCDHELTEQYGVVSEDMTRINGVDIARATFFIPVESR